MPWFKVDDTLHSHPKTRRAGLAAMGIWVVAGSYSCQYVTEGFIPDWFISGQKNGHKYGAILVSAGFWIRHEKDGEKGYLFHDWDHFQMSKAEVEADRAHNRERQRKYREKRRESQRNAVTNGVTDSVSNAETNGGSNGPPTQPVPTQPDPTPPTSKSNTEVSEVTHVGGEPLSRSFPSNVVLIANRYTDRVKLSDRTKVCTVVDMALKSGYLSTNVEDALGRLAVNGLPVTPDTLRIEIEGRPNFANGRASPSRHDENAAVVEQMRQAEQQQQNPSLQIEAR
jgi:hypothetical protein